MDEVKQSEEAMLYQNLQMLEEVRLALNEVIDGRSKGPGAWFADKVLSLAWIVAFLIVMMIAIYPIALTVLEMDELLWRVVVAAVATLVGLKVAHTWAERYIKSKGTWDEYISSRLNGYQAAKPEGLQYVKNHAVDGNLDAQLLKTWIELEEVPALIQRLQELLPRATIRIAD